MQNSLTPYRKRSASKAIKRKYARRRLFAPNEVSAIRMPAPRVAGFPDKLRTSIKYIEYVQLDAGATTVAKAQYRMNGLVDPTVAVGGHQPLGFDNFMAVYQKFEVLNCKVRFTNINASDAHFVYGIVVNELNETVPTSANTLLELGKNCIYQFCHGYGTSKQYAQYVEVNRNIARNLGYALGDDVLKGTATTDPSQQLLATLFCGTIDGTDVAAQGFCVCLEYDVVFSTPQVNQTAN